MQTDKDIPGISCGLVGNNVFEWEIMLMLNEEQDSLYGGELNLGNIDRVHYPRKSEGHGG